MISTMFDRTPWKEPLPFAPLRAGGIFFCLLLMPMILFHHGLPELYITPTTMMTALIFCIAPPEQLGMGKVCWKDVGIVLLFYIAMMIIIACLSPMWELLLDCTGLDIQKKQEVLQNIADASGQTLLYLFICTCIITPVVEEVLFRRIIYNWFADCMPLLPAVLITSMLFSLAHLFFYGMVSLFVMGFMFNMIYLFRRNLWLAIMLHSTVNTAAFWIAVLTAET